MRAKTKSRSQKPKKKGKKGERESKEKRREGVRRTESGKSWIGKIEDTKQSIRGGKTWVPIRCFWSPIQSMNI